MQSSLEEPFRYSPTASVVVATAGAESLEKQTRQEISSLVAEMGELSRSPIEPEIFWPEFAQRLLRAMAAEWVWIWSISKPDQFGLVAQSGETISEASIRHTSNQKTLHQVIEGRRPVLVPPHDNDIENGCAARTMHWSAFVPLSNEDEGTLVIECGLKEVGGPASQRGYLRFVAQMSDLAHEYMRSCALKRWREASSVWHVWEQATHELARCQTSADFHRLAVDACARTLQVARVSWFSKHSGTWKLQASSGIDAPDARGAAAKWLTTQIDPWLQQSNQEQDASNPSGLPIVAALPLYWPSHGPTQWQSYKELQDQAKDALVSNPPEATSRNHSRF